MLNNAKGKATHQSHAVVFSARPSLTSEQSYSVSGDFDSDASEDYEETDVSWETSQVRSAVVALVFAPSASPSSPAPAPCLYRTGWRDADRNSAEPGAGRAARQRSPGGSERAAARDASSAAAAAPPKCRRPAQQPL